MFLFDYNSASSYIVIILGKIIGNVPIALSKLSKIIVLDLSHNMFSGEFNRYGLLFFCIRKGSFVTKEIISFQGNLEGGLIDLMAKILSLDAGYVSLVGNYNINKVDKSVLPTDIFVDILNDFSNEINQDSNTNAVLLHGNANEIRGDEKLITVIHIGDDELTDGMN
jgi:hypothetical protein